MFSLPAQARFQYKEHPNIINIVFGNITTRIKGSLKDPVYHYVTPKHMKILEYNYYMSYTKFDTYKFLNIKNPFLMSSLTSLQYES